MSQGWFDGSCYGGSVQVSRFESELSEEWIGLGLDLVGWGWKRAHTMKVRWRMGYDGALDRTNVQRCTSTEAAGNKQVIRTSHSTYCRLRWQPLKSLYPNF